jgi:predicted glycoside hydrolase/deacetylase ChbG (UPF0249 family)
MKQHNKFFLNADDFGMSDFVNAEIVRLYKIGVIQRATILVTSPFVNEAISLAKQHNIKVGLHFNFGEFPLLSQSLDDVKTSFWQKSFLKRMALAFRYRREITGEVVSQIEFLRSAGLNIEHLDSHHHVHLRPELILHVINACRVCNISSIRGFRNLTTKKIDGAFACIAKKVTKNFLNAILRSVFNIKVTTYFGSISDYVASVDAGIDFNKQKNSSFELMVHPGNAAAGYPYITEIRWLENNFINHFRRI